MDYQKSLSKAYSFKAVITLYLVSGMLYKNFVQFVIPQSEQNIRWQLSDWLFPRWGVQMFHAMEGFEYF